jgi:hypothetical protein
MYLRAVQAATCSCECVREADEEDDDDDAEQREDEENEPEEEDAVEGDSSSTLRSPRNGVSPLSDESSIGRALLS